MSVKKFRIGVMAPANRIDHDLAGRVTALAVARYGDAGPEFTFHPQCYESWGHFAGNDAARAKAFLDIANDPSIDALWFARGGYGSNRIVDDVLAGLKPIAANKTYMGYSDCGFLLAALYSRGFAHVAHGPVLADLNRKGDHGAVGGEDAFFRGLRWLIDRAPDAIESSVSDTTPSVALNISILDSMIGTPLQPDLSGHVLMLEEVEEYLYVIDRALFHITENRDIRKVAGIRLGRCSAIPDNDPPFQQTPEEIVRHWCMRSGIPYLGSADIGHDIANKIVPFGLRTMV